MGRGGVGLWMWWFLGEGVSRYRLSRVGVKTHVLPNLTKVIFLDIEYFSHQYIFNMLDKGTYYCYETSCMYYSAKSN